LTLAPRAAVGRRRSPSSSLCTFPDRGFAQRCLAPGAGGSLTLAGFTRKLSQPVLNSIKSLAATSYATVADAILACAALGALTTRRCRKPCRAYG
jgi:hypothetical protein